MTYRELVYMCLDEIKASSDDAYVTEDHILFLISKYRNLVLRRKYEKTNMPVAESNYQRIQGETTVRIKIPQIMDLGYPLISIITLKSSNDFTAKSSFKTTYVPARRFEFVGNNSYLINVVYSTVTPEGELKCTSIKYPQVTNISNYTIYAVFEDIIEASKTTLKNGADILDADCPIETELIPEVQELVVKDILGIAYRPQDKINNGSDDLNLVNAQKSK